MNRSTDSTDRSSVRAAVGALFAVVALVLSFVRLGYPSPWWVALVVVPCCAVLVAAVPDWAEAGEALSAAQYLSVVLALYACVPETDHVPMLLAALIGHGIMRLVGWTTRTSAATLAVGVLLLVTTGLMGAAGRTSAYLGVLIVMASMTVLPFVRRRRPDLSPATSWLIVVAVGVLDLVAARTIGIAGT